MAMVLQELLRVDRTDFKRFIDRLEHVAMQPSIDIRLNVDSIARSNQKMIELGLDPEDTTPQELYSALIVRAARDSKQLAQSFGVATLTDDSKALVKIVDRLQKNLKQQVVFSMQPAALKSVLKAVPPKKTLKLLKLRSIDAVLKRENPIALYAIAKVVEEKSWHTQMQARLKRTTSKDIKYSPIKIVILPEDWLQKIGNDRFRAVTETVQEMGALVLQPTIPLQQEGAVLLLTGIVYQAAQNLVVQSLPYQKQMMVSTAEVVLPEMMAGRSPKLEPIYGITPDWQLGYRVLAQHKSHLEDSFLLGDLSWEHTEYTLAQHYPELKFWVDTHMCGIASRAGVVSFHVLDVAANCVLERSLGRHITSHVSASLWNELQFRYLSEAVFEKALISQLAK